MAGGVRHGHATATLALPKWRWLRHGHSGGFVQARSMVAEAAQMHIGLEATGLYWWHLYRALAQAPALVSHPVQVTLLNPKLIAAVTELAQLNATFVNTINGRIYSCECNH